MNLKALMKFIKTQERKKRLFGIQYENGKAVYDAGCDLPRCAHQGTQEYMSEDKRFVPAYILLDEIYKKTDNINEAGRNTFRGNSKTGHNIFLLRWKFIHKKG
jgi:hypothetical protein